MHCKTVCAFKNKLEQPQSIKRLSIMLEWSFHIANEVIRNKCPVWHLLKLLKTTEMPSVKFQTLKKKKTKKNLCKVTIGDNWLVTEKQNLIHSQNLTSNSACLCTSSALCLFKINSASFATRTIWSFIAWHSNLKRKIPLELILITLCNSTFFSNQISVL